MNGREKGEEIGKEGKRKDGQKEGWTG